MSDLINFSSLCQGHIYKIPLNQRGFSWSEENLEELIDDSSLAGTESHFMGTIVATTIEGGNLLDFNGVALGKWRLDDGQQRITALMIFINEIRNRLKTLGGDKEKEAATEIEKLLFYDETETTKSFNSFEKSSVHSPFIQPDRLIQFEHQCAPCLRCN